MLTIFKRTCMFLLKVSLCATIILTKTTLCQSKFLLKKNAKYILHDIVSDESVPTNA